MGYGFEKNDAVGHAFPTERSRDNRTAQEVAAFIPWVSRRALSNRQCIDIKNRLRTSFPSTRTGHSPSAEPVPAQSTRYVCVGTRSYT